MRTRRGSWGQRGAVGQAGSAIRSRKRFPHTAGGPNLGAHTRLASMPGRGMRPKKLSERSARGGAHARHLTACLVSGAWAAGAGMDGRSPLGAACTGRHAQATEQEPRWDRYAWVAIQPNSGGGSVAPAAKTDS